MGKIFGKMEARLKLSLKFLLIALLLAAAGSAEASVANQSKAKKTYPDAKISCKTCHQNAIGRATDLNAYGTALHAKKLDFKALEGEDSDGDGAANLAEIKAGTNPGDKTSKP